MRTHLHSAIGEKGTAGLAIEDPELVEELLREWREHLGIVMNVWDVVGGSKSERGHPWRSGRGSGYLLGIIYLVILHGRITLLPSMNLAFDEQARRCVWHSVIGPGPGPV